MTTRAKSQKLASKMNSEMRKRGGRALSAFLYKDGILRSDRARAHVRLLATRHPRTKFVSIIGDKCIPNLPDSRVPMFIVYRKGEIVTQITAWGSDRERKLEELEALFIGCGAIVAPEKEMPVDPDDVGDESEEEGHDRSSQIRSKSTWVNYSSKSVRQAPKKDDSDSDFDL